MLRFPWIAREAYVDMRAERDRLLTLVEKYADHERRTDRRVLGMPENPVQPKAPFDWRDYMDVWEQCKRWSDPVSKRVMAERELRSGTPREQVMAMLDARDVEVGE
jgi:hypothetical protein